MVDSLDILAEFNDVFYIWLPMLYDFLGEVTLFLELVALFPLFIAVWARMLPPL